MHKIVISGYYGFGNTGDESILQGMIDSFKKEIPAAEIVVLSHKPEKTAQAFNIKSIQRKDYFNVFKNILNCSLFISGGGGLLQDITSLKSLRYYLGLIQTAQFLRKPTMIYAQSIGPVNTPSGQKLAKKVCSKVNFITVRDESSKQLLRDLGVVKPPVKITADPVFCLEPSDDIKNKIKFETAKIKIGISVRPWKLNVDYIDVLANFLNYLIQKWNAEIIILPFQISQDLEICKVLQQKINTRTNLVSEELSPLEWLFVIRQLDYLVGIRLHSLIMACMSNVPFIGISYDPKVAGFLKSCEMPSLDINTLKQENLISSIENIKKNYNHIKEELKNKVPQFKEKALENVKIVKELLK